MFTRFEWSPVPGATGYDIVRGNLGSLRSFDGFDVGDIECLGNDYTYPEWGDEDVPAVHNGFWYLVRAVNCGGFGSYDDTGAGLSESRDPVLGTTVCP
jgi:hypothetical protein